MNHKAFVYNIEGSSLRRPNLSHCAYNMENIISFVILQHSHKSPGSYQPEDKKKKRQEEDRLLV